MSEQLIIDPNDLYKLYGTHTIREYYEFSFLPKFTSIEVDIFYDILNSIPFKLLQNLNNYIYKQWSLCKVDLDDGCYGVRKQIIVDSEFSYENISDKNSFNDKLQTFINGDQVKALYCMNQMLKFLYPC